MDWRNRYSDKLTSGERAVAQIRPGDRIYIGSGSAVPLGLLPHLVAMKTAYGDNEIVHMLTLGEAPYVEPMYEGVFRHNALFIGSNVRKAVVEGRADYTPVFLSEIPRLIRKRQIPIDVALISVTPPDKNQTCSLGTHVDIALAAIEMARVVIAEVNPCLPNTFGCTRISLDTIDYLVEIEHALPELHPPALRPEIEAIAANVARLVMDGATLQLGIGAVPDAVLRALRDHHDLGIHTEMFSDGVVDLVERGVITGRKKSLNSGKIVSSFLMGSRRLYDFVDGNPTVELYPVDYTNDPMVIAQNDNMVAVNTALEVDLTGQVCADSIGDRFYSGIGGQVDFIRGAARSMGGKPIIAIPSTAAGGDISRIVPQLSDGAGVVTTRGDVHFVVTEYGIAYLHGKTVRQRAMELIQIAHPKFRCWLLAEAKRRKFVYRDQMEPAINTSVYPHEFESNKQTSDGESYRIRPIKISDEPMLHQMFYQFTQETIYHRFFAVQKYFGHKDLQKFCTIDYEKDMTLVATVRDDVITRVVGLGLYVRDSKTDYGDAAFVVADEYQGRGIGSELIRKLTEIGRRCGLRGYTADMLAHNTRMMHVFEKLGYPTTRKADTDVVSLRIEFPNRDK